MTVYLEKQKFPYLNASMLHLRWSWRGWCRASETPTHPVLSTSLNDCGTTVTEVGDLIIFTNEIQGDIQVQNYITRDHDFDLRSGRLDNFHQRNLRRYSSTKLHHQRS